MVCAFEYILYGGHGFRFLARFYSSSDGVSYLFLRTFFDARVRMRDLGLAFIKSLPICDLIVAQFNITPCNVILPRMQDALLHCHA
jgi:hypothetical protein